MEQRGEKIIKDSAHVQNYAQWGRWLRAYDARLARSTGKPDDRSPDYWVSWRSVHTIVTSAHPECASVQVAWKNVGDRYRVTSPAANLPEPDFNTFQADPHHVLHRCYVASLMLLGCEAEARRHVTQLDFAVQVYKAEYADPMFFLGDDPVLYVSIEQWISEYRTLLASGTEAACYLDARR